MAVPSASFDARVQLLFGGGTSTSPWCASIPSAWSSAQGAPERSLWSPPLWAAPPGRQVLCTSSSEIGPCCVRTSSSYKAVVQFAESCGSANTSQAHSTHSNCCTMRFAEGWNGLRVEITLVPVEGSGEAWAIFDVTSGPALQPAAPAEAATPPTDAKPEEPSAGEQATKLDASLNGWAFRLPEFAASRLTWKIEDLLTSQGTS